jgi:hypothetical protein
MSETADRLSDYLEHLQARVRVRQGRATAADREGNLADLPESIAALCSRQPDQCLALIVRVLAEALPPEEVAAIGEGLLEDLLNEHAATIADKVAAELRTNQRFRQAFGFGHHSSVDPALIEEWVRIFQRLGTTKERERKSTWRRAGSD